MNLPKKTLLYKGMLMAGVVTLAGCNFDNDVPEYEAPPVAEEPDYSSPLPDQEPLSTFDDDGQLQADISWTTYGVPYVTADNLESMAFGVGYAYAQDNLCILADQIVKFNSQRSQFFGPDNPIGSGNSQNLIDDFGFLALGIRDNAEQGYDSLSEESQALLEGYAAGYNKYLGDTPTASLDPQCAGQPFVREITPVDVLTYAQGVALLPGASNFTGAIFAAAPPGEDFSPTPVMSSDQTASIDLQPVAIEMPEANPTEMGSNGWAIGRDLSATGQGMLLANPHFPHTGNQRFWQFGIEIPGELKVAGGSLSGMPGVVNIGFNENVAWTHTFSTANRFVVHQLELDPADDNNLTYLVDGEPKEMTTKTHQIQVNVGGGQTITLEKTSYHSEFGAIIKVPGSPITWGVDDFGKEVAYAIYDANLPNYEVLDHWLAMNRARNIEEYRQSYIDYTGTVFNNAMAVDDDGDAFFTDGSSVPNISDDALAAWQDNQLLQGISSTAGFPVMPGNSAMFKADGKMPFSRAPSLLRTDFVQNSNNSYWLTNPAEPIDDVATLWGPTDNEQSWRSRLGQKMLAEGGSVDGKFTREDIAEKLLSNRSFLAEEVLEPLLSLCERQGEQPVSTVAGEQNIKPACDVLAQWDGTMNKDSVGAMLFREFATEFANDPKWTVDFDPQDPLNTPRGLANNVSVLSDLGNAMVRIESLGLSIDAPLGEVQFVERALPTGQPSGQRLPWGGANNIEGGFNVFRANTGSDGTIYPRLIYPEVDGSNLTEAGLGYHISYGSSWMFTMEFTEEGPLAHGLLSYSQSRNIYSDHYLDQTLLYSQEPQLRPIWFDNAEVEENAIRQETINLTTE
ncbi:acylase [Idiomarina seosinensis]|uniref:Acylase n=1 Tax=Idiomarina seosinensis TaxID=281739 RepID=A0A432Z4I6_9GAMM|nr:acylase [Idiomarina seosinensis]RUO72800.1 acylase [Idiomarina seosinensis]